MFLYIRTSIFLNYLFQTRHITREPESLVSRGTNSNLKSSGKFENKILSKCTSVYVIKYFYRSRLWSFISARDQQFQVFEGGLEMFVHLVIIFSNGLSLLPQENLNKSRITSFS